MNKSIIKYFINQIFKDIEIIEITDRAKLNHSLFENDSYDIFQYKEIIKQRNIYLSNCHRKIMSLENMYDITIFLEIENDKDLYVSIDMENITEENMNKLKSAIGIGKFNL